MATGSTTGSAALLALMGALDAGTNMHGALSPELRARIYAAVNAPSQHTWDAAYSIEISAVGGCATLWQAVLKHTDYPVRGRPSGAPWSQVPTAGQLITALCAELA